VRIPSPCLVILIGPSASGKSTWAAEHFRPDQIVSSDALRSLVGEGPHDLAATDDAFDVLERVLQTRLARGLTTVVDSLGLEPARRQRWLALAASHGLPAHAVLFDTPAEVCRERNRSRPQPVPAQALTQQIRAYQRVAGRVAEEPFAAVHRAGDVEVRRPELVDAPKFAARQRVDGLALRFGLQIPRFAWPGGKEHTAERLVSVARAAERAGFSSLWVMDHFIQIPQVGREWEDMLESWTTLAFLAGHTSAIELGTLVTGITYRNVGHVAKIVATLDVLSGGRAWCGLGAAWFEREHRAYGWDFPPLADRYALLEDALRLLPLMWGPGAPPFEGARIRVAEALCYPRPIRDHVPILVGGGGEKRTLALAARYADACNIFGPPEMVARKAAVLRQHCVDAGRDPADIDITHLSTALVAENDRALDALVDRLRTGRESPDRYAARVNAASVDDHVGRFRALREAGVSTAIVSLPNLEDDEAPELFGAVIREFSPAPS
jgi:F420-dependent oxidoreductase-like protein